MILLTASEGCSRGPDKLRAVNCCQVKAKKSRLDPRVAPQLLSLLRSSKERNRWLDWKMNSKLVYGSPKMQLAVTSLLKAYLTGRERSPLRPLKGDGFMLPAQPAQDGF